MRVVNSIERELLQSEWENWLVNEKSMCDNLSILLHEDDKARKEKGPKKSPGLISAEKRKSVEKFVGDHCESCIGDHQAVMAQRKLSAV